MLGTADYLQLTARDASNQWASIRARELPPPGKRQVDFAPVETLLCLAASLVVNHRKYGSTTAERAEQPVPTLARLFARPNSSVLAKMANLDGSRPNGAKHESAVAAELLTHMDRLAATYRLIIRAGRDLGIGPDRLPDFLELEHTAASIELLGQQELDPGAIEEMVLEGSSYFEGPRLHDGHQRRPAVETQLRAGPPGDETSRRGPEDWMTALTPGATESLLGVTRGVRELVN